ncbi:helix-turn-helix domain-containing protein [Mesobacillus maritimus]|uniref:helix-turn-helix domain-containing protein n=1 Tax=Mesobacillus maritimus TaxID=1643336 RepID=UPI00203C082B|nr:helix-turn-helix domain-containing protein [Mesobacillus maritimus]
MTELGDRFKQEREAKGLSLNQLQDMTKIQKRYLAGIEEGNYAMMPGKFYVRAFIKQYAEALDLDPDEIFEQYKNDIPTTYNEDLPEQLSRVQSRKSFSNRTSKVLDLLPKLLIGLFVIGAIVLVWYWMVQSASKEENDQVNQGNNPVNIEEQTDIVTEDENAESGATEEGSENSADTNEDTKKEDEETAEEQEELTQSISVAEKNGSSTVYELTDADTFELEVVSTGATWVSVKNGAGKTFFEKTLQKGDKETVDFTDQTEAFLRIGNVPGTELYINGEKLEYAVSPNEQTTQNITIRYTTSE